MFGNAAAIYMNIVGCRETGNSHLLLACVTVPIYWLMMSIAAAKGCWQLLRNPSYWEKTFHGLGTPSPSPGRPTSPRPPPDRVLRNLSRISGVRRATVRKNAGVRDQP